VLVTDFTCAVAIASLIRSNLIQMAQVRSAAVNKDEKLELLVRYLSGIEFRQRVEAVVDAFARMREDLDQERRAAERQWAKRAKQIESVTFNSQGCTATCRGSCRRCRRSGSSNCLRVTIRRLMPIRSSTAWCLSRGPHSRRTGEAACRLSRLRTPIQ
jgi:hypothetical protein